MHFCQLGICAMRIALDLIEETSAPICLNTQVTELLNYVEK